MISEYRQSIYECPELPTNIDSIINFKFGNENDPFHQILTRFIQGLEITFSRGTTEELRMAQMDPFLKPNLSIYGLVESVKLIKKEFPVFFEEKKYQICLDILKKCSQKHNIPFPEKEACVGEEFAVRRQFNPGFHQQLVLFCGHLQEGCGGHTDDTYFVSIEEKISPDIVANFYSKSFWLQFPDKSLNYVNLEGYTPIPRTHQLQEISRILKDNGRARFPECIEWTSIHNANSDLLKSYFNKYGFKGYEIVLEEYHTCGRMQPVTSTYLYK